MSGESGRPRALVVATANPGKLREIREILADLEAPVEGLPEAVALPEEGDDYAANAVAKARAAAAALGLPAVADDSGIEVAALGGRPGPHSARYGGEGLDDAGRVQRLLEETADVPDGRRGARFVCVAAVAAPDGDAATAFGEVRGRLLRVPRGAGGFGYDPIFEADEAPGHSTAEIPADHKHALSHRGRAFRALVPEIRKRLRG